MRVVVKCIENKNESNEFDLFVYDTQDYLGKYEFNIGQEREFIIPEGDTIQVILDQALLSYKFASSSIE